MSFYDIIQALLRWLKNSSAFSAKMAQLYNSVYRLVRNLYDDLVMNHAKRIFFDGDPKPDRQILSLITVDDFKPIS